MSENTTPATENAPAQGLEQANQAGAAVTPETPAGIAQERRKRQIAERTFVEPPKAEDDTFLTQRDVQTLLQKERETERRRQADAAFRERLEKAKQSTGINFDEIVNDATLPVSPAMAEELRTSDKAPELLAYLHKNRSEALRLFGMDHVSLAREMVRLESRLQPSRTVTSASEPIEPVSGRGEGPTAYRDDMTVAEYEAWARKQRGGSLWPK